MDRHGAVVDHHQQYTEGNKKGPIAATLDLEFGCKNEQGEGILCPRAQMDRKFGYMLSVDCPSSSIYFSNIYHNATRPVIQKVARLMRDGLRRQENKEISAFGDLRRRSMPNREEIV